MTALNIAMLSIHSSPVGALGTQDTGGMSVYVRETARALGCLGHRVDIFTQHTSGNRDRVLDLYDNVRLIHLPGGAMENIPKAQLYAYLPNLLVELASFQKEQRRTYDVVHSHYWLSGVLGTSIQKLWQASHLITYHTIGAMKNRAGRAEKESELRLASESRLAKACDAVIVSGNQEKDNLIRYVDVPEDKIRVIPCGVNFERFKPIGKESARRRLALASETAIVLYVGRYAPVKGIDRLFKAMSHLQHLASLRLVLVGGDGESSRAQEHLQAMAKDLGIQQQVIFAGRAPHEMLPVWYSAADVLAVPSDYESFGLVALEALACGTPVVATPVGAMATVIQDGITGYVADNLDARHFAQLLETAVLAQRRGAYVRADIRASVAHLTWAKSASLLFATYQQSLEITDSNKLNKSHLQRSDVF